MDAIRENAARAGLASSVSAERHDVRVPLPVPDGSFDACYFIVHFFDRTKVDRLAEGFELLAVEEFEEGKLPRRLFRVVMRKG